MKQHLPSIKQFIGSKKAFVSVRGFSLIEFLIYMGVLSLLIFALSDLFSSTLDVQRESESSSSVDQDSQYILTRLSYDMHQASAMSTPSSAGQTSSSLQIIVNSVNYTYSLDGNGNLQLATNLGTDQVNSVNTKLTNLAFQRIGNSTSTDTIIVQMTIQSRTKRKGGVETRAIETTLALP